MVDDKEDDETVSDELTFPLEETLLEDPLSVGPTLSSSQDEKEKIKIASRIKQLWIFINSLIQMFFNNFKNKYSIFNIFAS